MNAAVVHDLVLEHLELRLARQRAIYEEVGRLQVRGMLRQLFNGISAAMSSMTSVTTASGLRTGTAELREADQTQSHSWSTEHNSLPASPSMYVISL